MKRALLLLVACSTTSAPPVQHWRAADHHRLLPDCDRVARGRVPRSEGNRPGIVTGRVASYDPLYIDNGSELVRIDNVPVAIEGLTVGDSIAAVSDEIKPALGVQGPMIVIVDNPPDQPRLTIFDDGTTLLINNRRGVTISNDEVAELVRKLARATFDNATLGAVGTTTLSCGGVKTASYANTTTIEVRARLDAIRQQSIRGGF